MIRRADECAVSVREAMRGGPGSVKQVEVAKKEEMFSKARLFAKLVLEPGCGIGQHVHEGECEIFYVLKGCATYFDNGTEVTLRPGDVAVCGDGESHAVTNNGTETLEIIAVIPTK